MLCKVAPWRNDSQRTCGKNKFPFGHQWESSIVPLLSMKMCGYYYGMPRLWSAADRLLRDIGWSEEKELGLSVEQMLKFPADGVGAWLYLAA